MCGRYALTHPVGELVEVFDVDVPTFDDWPVRFNLAPTQQAPVVLRGGEGERRLGPLRWGLVPHWADDPSIGSRMINARAETLGEKPAFREAFRARRCLVPMSGFYEWRKPARGDGPKTPFLIRRPDGAPFAVAGLWERWRGDDAAEPLTTFTIVTTAPSGWMRELHDRMPAVLVGDAGARWLDPEAGPEEWSSVLGPAPDDFFEAVEVSTAVNSPRNDRPEVAEPRPGGKVLSPRGDSSDRG